MKLRVVGRGRRRRGVRGCHSPEVGALFWPGREIGLEVEPIREILRIGVCTEARISELGRIAPVTAVRGNNDREGPTSLYPLDATEVLGGCRIFLVHEMKVPKRPKAPEIEAPEIIGYREAGVDVVVFGHSHIAFQEYRGDVLFFNPGAAGKRRFKVVPSIGFLTLEEGRTEGKIVPL